MTFNLEAVRRQLIAEREYHGAKTPIGHRCSNIVKLLETRTDAIGDHVTHIDANLTELLGAIERLCAACGIE